MTYFHKKTVRVGISLLLTFVSSWGIFAQTNITLDPACQSCPPSATLNSSSVTPVPTPMPSCGTVAGTYKVGTALTAANTITLSLNVVTAGAYTIATTATNGMTFTGSGTFAGTGAQTAVLTGSGTPTASGTTAVLVQYGGSTCASAVNVASNFTPTGITTGGGSLSGRTCFDIALSNDNANNCGALSARTPQKADFTLPAINTQTYTFTPTGTVSNVRFYYINTTGNAVTAMSGGNTGNNISVPIQAIVNYNTSNNSLALGLTATTALKTDIYVVYNINPINNNTPADDRVLKITANVKDCMCCGAWSYVLEPYTPTIKPATPKTKVWLDFMCYNLGAETSTADPFSYNAGAINGDKYQWGRAKDGHQLANAPYFSGTSPTITPNNNIFYSSDGNSGTITDWVDPVIINNIRYENSILSGQRWGRITSRNIIHPDVINPPKGLNDPCPSGYKVPSYFQFVGLLTGIGEMQFIASADQTSWANSWVWTGNGFKVGSSLYLPAAGARVYNNGLVEVGQTGYYWASTPYYDNVSYNNQAYKLQFGETFVNPWYVGGYQRSCGLSVRCVAE
jgi:uncharacterized protein (TIGR02145 family)